MRLWHKDIIPFLPRQQLLGQWRECCLIAKSIAEKGTPNHILVNKIINYPISDFIWCAWLVYNEMKSRQYKTEWNKFMKYFLKCFRDPVDWKREDIFKGWHDDVYLRECLYNLEEKARAGGIAEEEWKVIYEKYKDFTPLWKGN